MRIRTQLLLSAVLTAAATLLLVAGLVTVTRQARAGLHQQLQASEVARSVGNLLALTNEFAVYGGPRPASQWRTRHAQLLAVLDETLQRPGVAKEPLQSLRRSVDELRSLFEQLVQAGPQPGGQLAERRRDLLLERLLTETQEVVESRHRWALAIGQQQLAEQRLHNVVVLAAPLVLLMVVGSLGVLVSRRVLRPMGRLQRAAVAIQGGQIESGWASDAADEIGDAARAVDAMATALQQQGAALRLSEQRLRLITDSLPALVAHVDTQQRYTFANAHFARTGAGDPQALVGRTLRQDLGDAAHAELAAQVEKVLAGRPTAFETSRWRHGRQEHLQSTFVPDRDEQGGVRGFYAMTFDITGRKEAELRLAASERLLTAIADNMPGLVAYIDHERVYRFANQKYREWLGLDPAALIGRSVEDVISERNREASRLHQQRALAGERVHWEVSSRREGRDVWYLADFIPDRDAQGKVQGFYSLTIDITERRNAELAVARSEQRLVDLMNQIPAMVGYFDMAERCQYANDAGLRSQGLSRSDVPGISLRAALGERNYAQHEPYVRQALAGRRSRLEGKIPFQGRDAHFQAHLIPDRVDGGEQRGFYLMTFDITALKEAQKKQARVEHQLRAITDSLPALIAYVDHTERLVFVNATVRSWVGAEPAALIGLPFDEAVPENADPQRRQALRTALSGQRVEFSTESEAAFGGRSVQSVFIPDIQSDGSVAGVYMLTSDITDMKLVERQLRQLARVDSLTELPNRRQFEERLNEAMARSSRAHRPLALMFMDIDHFKTINDTWGHAVGDAVLKEFAARLRRSVRLTDMPARLAGDEFVVLLEGLQDERDALLVADKLLTAVRKPFAVGPQPLQVTTSIGITYGHGTTDQGRLLDTADGALYEAKKAGRNTYRLRLMPQAEALQQKD